MSDGATRFKTTLEGGTWSNYTSGPPSILVKNDTLREAANPDGEYIELEPLLAGGRETTFTFDGSVAFTRYKTKGTVYGNSTTTVQNIYDDILSITKSNYAFNVSGEGDVIPFKSRYIITFMVEFIGT